MAKEIDVKKCNFRKLRKSVTLTLTLDQRITFKTATNQNGHDKTATSETKTATVKVQNGTATHQNGQNKNGHIKSELNALSL